MSAMGGIGQQVAGDLFELGKGVVKGAAKAVTDIATDSIEQILSAPAGAVNKEPQKSTANTGEDDKKDQQTLLKKRQEKRRFDEVRSELTEYIQRKKQQDTQIAQEKAQEEQQKKQEKNYEKQKKESFLQGLMKRLAGGSHGETDRQKE